MKKVNQLLVLMCVVALMGFAIGCDGGGSGGGCDGGSSGGGSNILDRTHAGWRNPNCWTCHSQDNHNSGLDPADCVECHGDNGAPNGHTTMNCSTCHNSPRNHPASSFPSDSCNTCH